MTHSELKLAAKDALRGKWGVAILTTLIFNLIVMAISFIPVLPLFVSPPLMLGISIMVLNLTRTGTADLENLFDGVKYYFTSLKASLLVILYIFLWSLIPVILMLTVFTGSIATNSILMLFVGFPLFMIASIPAIIAQIDYALIYFIMVDHPELGAREVLKLSKAMMKGNRFKFFILMLSFIGWFLVSMLTLFIGYLWLLPYIYVSIGTFYEQLKGSQPQQYSQEPTTF